jgi:hypothetical protein
MEQILKEFEDVFSEGNEIGRCEIEYFRIFLKHDRPIAFQPRRLSAANRAEVKRQVDELERLGLVRKSKSAYAAPVTLALKKDGTKRLCMDYVGINAITIDDREPMPNIQDVLDSFYDAQVLSKGDIKWCYWQVPVHPDDIHKTAFITQDGHFEWVVMPFGSKNAPALCNRMLRWALRGIERSQHFFDDISINGRNWREHNDTLRQILERLRKYNLKLRRDKCQFGVSEIEFLGHVVSNGNLKPQPAKVKAVSNYPTPRNLKEVQRFNGLSSYLRRYIPNFASMAAPITQLLRKDVPFIWGEKQETSFNAIKEALASQPVLSIFDPNAECELHTDASAVGVAGILFQNNHPIGYYSRRLSDAESRYTTTELECMAVVNSIEYFRIYLEGSKFTVVTDHKALVWLSNFKESKRRLFRWSTELSMYNFNVVHRPGKQLEHVDALSRAPVSLNTSLFTTINDIISCQHEEDIKPNGRMFLKNGIVSIKVNKFTKSVIPKKLISQLLKEHHEDVGHPGSNRTLMQIRQKYWWPTINKDTRNYVKSCHSCQLVKPVNHSPYGPLIPLPTPDQPLELIAMDTIVMSSSALNTSAKFIQVVIDHHSRFVWAKATKTNTAQAAISTLEPIFKIFGSPKRILTDNGTNFRSRVFTKFLRNHKVKYSYTTTYHPQTNGLNEKVNDTISRGLRLAMIDRPSFKWSTSLAKVIHDYNNTIHTVTGFTPSQLFLGKQLSDSDPSLSEIRRQAVEKSNKFKEKAKAIYDAKHKPLQLYPGDLVKRRISPNHPDNKKLTPEFEGPLRVIKQSSPVNYEVEYLNGNKRILTHVCQLEPYYQRELFFKVGENVID